MSIKLNGLISATHTPFQADGQLNLEAVARLAEHLLADGVKTVFIGGTTGESHSLAVDERLALAQRWSEVSQGTELRIVVHVGSNSLTDARTLASQAQKLGVAAIAAFSPSYFKPKDEATLVASCAEIAEAAPALPFYFYDIPSMTGVQLSMPLFLELATKSIPTIAGIKFTNSNLMAYQQCLHAQNHRFDIPWGNDETLLGALALGASGAVGSTYNFVAPLYHRLLAAFAKGDLAKARAEQYHSVELVELLSGYGFMGAAKTVMSFLGVDVGPARLPHSNLSAEQVTELKSSLEKMGFFDELRKMP